MGVLAVDATLKVGTISEAVMEQELSKREAPQVEIWKRGMTFDDLEFLRRQLTGVEAMATKAHMGTALILFQDQQADSWPIAVSEEFIHTTGRRILKGRPFITEDFTTFRSVAIIDEFLANQLFQEDDPINQRIYIKGRPYIVVGVIASLPQSNDGQGLILIPLAVHYSLTGSRFLRNIFIRPQSPEQLTALEAQVKDLFEEQFPRERFWISNNIEDLIQQRATLRLASQGLALVGLIALLVGGVGIANIMIAAVMERTPEIGLRLAIGATAQDILYQFILEATLLSLVGGIMAIATVHGLTLIVAHQFNLPYQFNPTVATWSLGSAAIVGIGAGFLPAWQASQLDPVKALRS